MKIIITEQQNENLNHKIKKVVDKLGVKEGIRLFGLDKIKNLFEGQEITFDLIEFIIDSFNWDEETLHDLVSDIFIEERYMMEDMHDREDYIGAILDWIIDGEFEPIEWIYEMNGTYGDGND